jgi:phosphoribosylformylglycinamidine cyclo-ligase
MTSDKYMKRGVSSQKEDVHAAIKNIDKGIFPQAFCKIVPDYLGGDEQYCNLMHADGAGTKSSLAYLYWKETGDLSVWKGIAQDAIVMNTNDLLASGVYQDILISSTIGRNKNLVPGEVIQAIIEGTEEFIDMLRSHGVNIHSTGVLLITKISNPEMLLLDLPVLGRQLTKRSTMPEWAVTA